MPLGQKEGTRFTPGQPQASGEISRDSASENKGGTELALDAGSPTMAVRMLDELTEKGANYT